MPETRVLPRGGAFRLSPCASSFLPTLIDPCIATLPHTAPLLLRARRCYGVKDLFQKGMLRARSSWPDATPPFIAPYAGYEYDLDLLFIAKNGLESQTFRMGMIMVDVFGKFTVVVPIKSLRTNSRMVFWQELCQF